MSAPPVVLVDDAVATGAAAALPAVWLDGCEVHTYPAGDLAAAAPESLAAAVALVARTMTRVDAALLERMPRLRAAATLSSGTDHLDLHALAAREVALSTGRGGNAVAVADWVEWALGRLRPGTLGAPGSLRSGTSGHLRPGPACRALVVGCGAVGEVVADRLQGTGWQVVLCDPPRARRDASFVSVDLDEAIDGGVDLITMHTPLSREGADATLGLLDAARVDRLAGALLFNAARGGVVDEAAAGRARLSGRLVGLAIDTFVGEPRPSPALVAAADLATAHVAGHSIEGKLRVAWLALCGLRRSLGLDDRLDLDAAIDAVVDALRASHAPILDPGAVLDAASRDLTAATAAGRGFTPLRNGHRRLEAGSPRLVVS